MTNEQTDITKSPAVRTWQLSYQEFWREGQVSDEAIETLDRFVKMYETTPDAMIDEVLRPGPQGEGLVLRTRARRKYMQMIDEFEQAEGSRKKANHVRSFMIHNGVAMNPDALK